MQLKSGEPGGMALMDYFDLMHQSQCGQSHAIACQQSEYLLDLCMPKFCFLGVQPRHGRRWRIVMRHACGGWWQDVKETQGSVHTRKMSGRARHGNLSHVHIFFVSLVEV